MYELEIAIAKSSSNKKRDELIKLHNGYMSEYDKFKEANHLVSSIGICFLVVLVILGYFIGIAIAVRTCPICFGSEK